MGRLFWLASYPKSGNTWVRLFLHNFVMQPSRPYDINRLNDFSTSEDMAVHYRRHDPRPASRYTIEDVQRLRPLVHRDLQASRPGTVFVKTHNAALVVCGTPLLTPEVTAGAIYVLRDPRDVAVSYSHHFGITLDETIALMANPEAMTGGTETRVLGRPSSWSRHVESWTRSANRAIHVVRYEDMLADPVATFAGVIRFFGFEPPRTRLERAIAFSNFGELQSQERRAGFRERPATARQFFRAGRAGGWREALSPAQAERIATEHGVQMARFGYL